VLDAFAGSGAMAIEALSRGAASATMIEKDPQAYATAARNIQGCGFDPEQHQLIKGDAISNFKKLNRKFDIIFLDPPYGTGLLEEALKLCPVIMNEDAVVIAETGTETPPQTCLTLTDKRKYGANHFYLFTQTR